MDDLERSMEEIDKIEQSVLKFNPLSIKELMSINFPPVRWLVHSIIPRDSIVVLSGTSGVGKTWVELNLINSVSTGTPFLNNFEVEQGNVLLIGEEDSQQSIQERWKMLGYDVYEKEHFWLLVRSQFDIFTDLENLKEFIVTHQISLVCFDTFRDIFSGDENESGEISKVIKKFREINNVGASVLVTHHHRKSSNFGRENPAETLRGSSALMGSLDSHIYLKEISTSEIQVTQIKSRVSKKINPFKIEKVEEDGNISFKYGGDFDIQLEAKDKAKQGITVMYENDANLECSMKELIETLKDQCGKSAVEFAVKELCEDGFIEKYRKGGQGSKYFYSKKSDHFDQPENSLFS